MTVDLLEYIGDFDNGKLEFTDTGTIRFKHMHHFVAALTAAAMDVAAKNIGETIAGFQNDVANLRFTFDGTHYEAK